LIHGEVESMGWFTCVNEWCCQVFQNVSDITSAWYRLLNAHGGAKDVELMSADFEDAFNMLHLHK